MGNFFEALDENTELLPSYTDFSKAFEFVEFTNSCKHLDK